MDFYSDGMNDQLDLLTRATFELNDLGHHNEDLLFPSRESGEISSFFPRKISSTVPLCGLLYHVEEGAGTFCIRASPSRHLEKSRSALAIPDSPECRQMKLPGGSEFGVHQFITSTYEEAEMLVEQFGNKRFPYREDVLYSISNPGPNWYLDLKSFSLTVFFSRPPPGNEGNYLSLGPIGDSKIAYSRFAELQTLFNSYFSIEEWRLDERSLYVRMNTCDGLKWDIFQRLFSLGEFGDCFDPFVRELRWRSPVYYLKELAQARRFWLELDRNLRRRPLSE